jgi:phosphopantothenoylcysteine decarboxylase/phosphopantothenate--cysteine ligase
MLEGLRVALGVSGGIAAYKACELTSLLKKAGAFVRVVMTQSATEFVSPMTFETLSGNRASVDMFDRAWEIEHIALAKWADILLIAPATANILAKMAHGIADDLLTTVVSACPAPIAVAPAMNTQMWNNPANQQNMALLKARGVHVIGPARGLLACGDDDVGRMTEPEDILAALAEILKPVRDFSGKKVLVTAGPTREAVDPVRFLTNRSSGRMGIALAEAARDRGASVTLLLGPVAIEAPTGVEMVRIESTEELYDAAVSRAGGFDAILMAAAPADYRPELASDRKIKKTGGALVLTLVENPDIAQKLGEMKAPGQVLVAFAAETGENLENAREKRRKKNADLIVLNDVTRPGAGFDVDTNIVTLIGDAGEEALPVLPKRAVADKILDRVHALWPTAG